MSEKRFKVDMSANKQFCIMDMKERKLTTSQDTVADWLNSFNEENEQLKAKVKRLQDIATRTEAEKEKYADLYCKCENEIIKNSRRCDDV